MTQANPMQIAAQHFQAGRLAEAEKICRQILAQQPNHADALHILALVAKQTGHVDAAIELFTRAVQLNPKSADLRNNLGVTLKDLGRTDEAIAELNEAIRLDPSSADALNNLGTAFTAKDEKDPRAVDVLRRAIELRPRFAEAYNNLGIALKNQEKLDEAVATLQQAIALRPGYFKAFGNLGNALADQDKLDESAAALRQAIQFNPKFADAYYNLGNTLRRQHKIDEAIANYRMAIQLKPDYPEAYNNLGLSLSDQRKYSDALAAYEQALRQRPAYLAVYHNWGNTLSEQGKVEESLEVYRQAIALDPNLPDSYYGMALTLKEAGRLDESEAACIKSLEFQADYVSSNWLLAVIALMRGDFAYGWRQAESRWKCKQFPQAARDWARPQWMGEDLAGKTILIHAEQGFGDTLQFVRYAPLVAARGGKVILEIQPPLERLLQGFAGAEQIIAAGKELPAFDLHCPMLSLPLAFGTMIDSVPNQVPYLMPEQKLLEAWSGRMASAPPGLKVGIAWAGSPTHQNDRNRSVRLAQLAPLAAITGVTFYSLQKGPAVHQIAEPGIGIKLINLAEHFSDFAETAAMIAQLDLVISVDTVIAHLAGAMGKPVWVLLPRVPDWRWMLNRPDSPWYPTMELFRQEKAGEWDKPIARMVERLRERSGAGG